MLRAYTARTMSSTSTTAENNIQGTLNDGDEDIDEKRPLLTSTGKECDSEQSARSKKNLDSSQIEGHGFHQRHRPIWETPCRYYNSSHGCGNGKYCEYFHSTEHQVK